MGLEPKPPPKEKAAWNLNRDRRSKVPHLMPPAGGVGGPETRSRRLRVVGQVPSLAINKNEYITPYTSTYFSI